MFDLLQKSDLTLKANTANLETVIAEAIVPKGFAWHLPSEVMQMFLATKYTAIGDGTTTQFTLDDDLVDSPNLGDDNGAVVGYVDNVQKTISAVDYSGNKITFSTAPGNTTAIEVYHLFSEGNLKIRAAHPNGKSRFKTLFNRALGNIHIIDQYQAKSAPRISNAFLLPEKYRLQLLLNSSVVTDWDAENTVAQIAIPYVQVPMSELPADINDRVNALLI